MPAEALPDAKFDWQSGPITPQTPVTKSYKNTQNVRRFLTAECGAAFKFDRDFMARIRDGRDKSAEKSSVFGAFPGVFDVAEPALSVEQIRWAITDHLISNGNVAASCIARLGSLHDRLTIDWVTATRYLDRCEARSPRILNFGNEGNAGFGSSEADLLLVTDLLGSFSLPY